MDKLLIDYIKRELHGDGADLDIHPQDDLLGSGLVESMGMIKIIGFIEQQFDIAIPAQDMTIENFLTVEAMVNYIARRQSH